MKACAMVLAAGRGERMRPLTDDTPKPLLRARGKPLLQWPIEALARGGVGSVVVNTAWLGEQIEQCFGQEFVLPGQTSGDLPASGPGRVAITYSREAADFGGALETAGGIIRALPLLDDVFWLLAGDVFSPGFVFAQDAFARFAASGKLAHIWLVPNPQHHPGGDFGLECGLAVNTADVQFTYSTIGLYRQALFAPPYCDIAPGNPRGQLAALAPLLRAAMDHGLVSAELFRGDWADVGTPQRLELLNREAAGTPSDGAGCARNADGTDTNQSGGKNKPPTVEP